MYQVFHDFKDPSAGSIDALLGPLQHDLVRVGSGTREADYDPAVLCRYILHQLFTWGVCVRKKVKVNK